MGAPTGAESAPSARVQPLPFAVALGHRLRQLRERNGHTAADMAGRSKRLGLNWDRSTVARIELGQRQVTASELLVMTMLYGVGVVDLLPTEDSQLTETVTATPAGLRTALTEDRFSGGFHVEGLREDFMAALDKVTAGFRVVKSRLPGASDWEILSASEHVRDEATVKAAVRLQATAEEVAVAAEGLWHRSLTAERDARVEAMGPLESSKARQARRGHVTRGLLAELAPQVVQVRTAEGETDGER